MARGIFDSSVVTHLDIDDKVSQQGLERPMTIEACTVDQDGVLDLCHRLAFSDLIRDDALKKVPAKIATRDQALQQLQFSGGLVHHLNLYNIQIITLRAR